MKRLLILSVLSGCLVLPVLATAADETEAQDASEARRQAYEQAMQQAEAERREAEQAMQQARERLNQVTREAVQSAEQQREAERARSEEVRAMREALSAAHRELRQTQREIARVHRDLDRAEGGRNRYAVRFGGERAVIGIVLGSDEEAGVQVLGVSPDGPAERAGVRQGDVIVGINGQALTEFEGAPTPRVALHQQMQSVAAGDALKLEVLRGGEKLAFDLTAERRQPLIWEGIAPLPPMPDGPPVAPSIVIDRIAVPQMDSEALERHVERMTREVERLEFIAPDVQVEVDDGYAYAISSVGDQALREANLWFGLPMASGLRLSGLNEELGTYFNADQGVLVLNTGKDNHFGLRPGDVIQSINGDAVNQPEDVFRILRRHAPGDAVSIDIQRRQQHEVLESTIPEHMWPARIGKRAPVVSNRLLARKLARKLGRGI